VRFSPAQIAIRLIFIPQVFIPEAEFKEFLFLKYYPVMNEKSEYAKYQINRVNKKDA
jgi:hypothetical protein